MSLKNFKYTLPRLQNYHVPLLISTFNTFLAFAFSGYDGLVIFAKQLET